MSAGAAPRGAGLPSVFPALAYADVRALVNALRTLRKRAGRTLLWTGYVVFIVAFAVLKFATPHGAQPARPPFWQTAIGDLWVCALTIAFGTILATGQTRWLGVFTSRAEALFVTRAHAAPAAVAAYLQGRAVVFALGQTALRFAYLIIVGIPGGTTPRALAAELAFFAACGAAIASIALPRALARGRALVACVVVGWTIVAAGALPVIADAVRVFKLPPTAFVRALPAVHPGAVLTTLNAGDVRALAIPVIVALLASAAFVAVARDAYPELYAISLAHLEWRSKRSSRQAGAEPPDALGAPRATRRESNTQVRWPGAPAFVWADALEFSRRVSRTAVAVLAATAVGAGAGVAALARGTDNSLVLGILFGIVPAIYIGIASTVGVRLAAILRRPLFWLGDTPLVARLWAWGFGALWRDLALLALAAGGYLLVDHDAAVPGLAFVGGTGLLTLTRAVGLAVFALLPNALDQRGPAVMVRVAAATAMTVPAIVCGMVVGLIAGSVVTGTIAGTLVALAESAVLVGFAAWRLAGRVDLLSTAS